jgi:hypothetical protein
MRFAKKRLVWQLWLELDLFSASLNLQLDLGTKYMRPLFQKKRRDETLTIR